MTATATATVRRTDWNTEQEEVFTFIRTQWDVRQAKRILASKKTVKVGKKTYFMTAEHDAWLAVDGKQGPWAGRYDPKSKTFDTTAEEPEAEME